MDIHIIDGPVEDASEYLDTLQGYNITYQQDELLNIARRVWDADNYYPMIVPFPGKPNDLFNATNSGYVLQTFSGVVTVPAFSVLVKMTAYAGPDPDHPTLFKLRIYDKGGNVDLVYKQFSLADNICGKMTGQLTGQFEPQDDPFGPSYLLDNAFVMPPGALQVEITDLSGVANTRIQIAMFFAVPKNSQSLGMQQITDN